MNPIYHALVLNLHQPAGNLEHLLENQPWETKEILFALDRIPRVLWPYEDVARAHLALSGTLLETLSSPEFQSSVYGIVKCGDLLWHFQNDKILDLLGTGYYHPVFPLIPELDWEEQMKRWQSISRHLFAKKHFNGFWPPEMGFCMEMIPMLKHMGYQYVLVDSHHVEPVDSMSWQELRYRPHVARHGGEEITVVVRDRELSDAQESGMDFDWFLHEVKERTKWCDFPALVTTGTDGDNGGWFRNTNKHSNFWHAFYQPLLEHARSQDPARIQPTFIHDYLHQQGAGGEVKVRTGAWNTGWHNGIDFVQWTGSDFQQDTLQRVHESSQAFESKRLRIAEQDQPLSEQQLHHMNEARWRILRAETSCNFYWGEAWVQRCHDDLDQAWEHLNQIN